MTGASHGAPSRLLYLHGFRSSPRSFKARRLQDWLHTHRPDVAWQCPQLPPSPREAMAQVHALVAGGPADGLAVIGSSLGGFYATVLAEATGCRAVLLNPAVDPARDLAAHVGEQTAYHDPSQRFDFRAAYVDELRAMTPAAITRPGRYLVVIAQGDEVLDWREMSTRYTGCPQRVIEGSDHGLSDFDAHLGAILHFLHLIP